MPARLYLDETLNPIGRFLQATVIATWLLHQAAQASAGEPLVQSPSTDRQYIAFQVENDLFGNLESTDRHYTNGLQLSYLSKPTLKQSFIRDIATALVPLSGNNVTLQRYRYGLALGHSIFTPENVLATTLQVNDRPYAAWAHFAFTVQAEWKTSDSSSFQDKWKFDAGIVGPAAGGDYIQNTVHEIIDSEVISGWSNQLPNEAALNVSFERAWNTPNLEFDKFLGLQVDAIPFATGAFGNVQTALGGGFTIRVGSNLPNDFGPPRVYPATGGSEVFEVHSNEWNWYFFAGVEGRLVAHDMFLDGTLFSESHSVDKRKFVGDLRLGAAVTYDCFRLSFTQVQRSREFFGQPYPDKFGAITLGVAF